MSQFILESWATIQTEGLFGTQGKRQCNLIEKHIRVHSATLLVMNIVYNIMYNYILD